MRWTGDTTNTHRILISLTEVKILLRRPTRREEDNIKSYPKRNGVYGCDWISFNGGLM
jgi:hypothetical protein